MNILNFKFYIYINNSYVVVFYDFLYRNDRRKFELLRFINLNVYSKCLLFYSFN